MSTLCAVEASAFDAFGAEHFWATSLTFAMIALIVAMLGRLPKDSHVTTGRALAVLLIVYRVVETTMRASFGEPWPQLMPFHLCGMSVLLTAYVLWTRNDRVFQVAYFWVGAGATMSLITPDLQLGYPSFAFWSFFFGHGLPIFGIAFAVWVLGMRPKAKSIVIAMVAIWALAIPVAIFNTTFDTNYLFLCRKPLGETPFNYFGPWPWYLVTVNFVGLALFSLCYLPFARAKASS